MCHHHLKESPLSSGIQSMQLTGTGVSVYLRARDIGPRACESLLPRWVPPKRAHHMKSVDTQAGSFSHLCKC